MNFVKKPEKNKRYILLDSNIISRFDILEDQILPILREVVGYGYGLAISEFSIFELLSEASPKKEIQIIQALRGLTAFQIRQNILIACAHISSFYKEHNLAMTQFEIGDRIIAATALLGNCIIFTLNGRDFPQPFFKEIERRRLEYTNKESPVCVYSYFMEPQILYMSQYHQKRIEPFLSKENQTISDPKI